jgi:hypothetical protein
MVSKSKLSYIKLNKKSADVNIIRDAYSSRQIEDEVLPGGTGGGLLGPHLSPLLPPLLPPHHSNHHLCCRSNTLQVCI